MATENTKKKFLFKGSIISPFGQIIHRNWTTETWAVSPKKARSNFCWQAKQLVGSITHGYTIEGVIYEDTPLGNGWSVKQGCTTLYPAVK